MRDYNLPQVFDPADEGSHVMIRLDEPIVVLSAADPLTEVLLHLWASVGNVSGYPAADVDAVTEIANNLSFRMDRAMKSGSCAPLSPPTDPEPGREDGLHWIWSMRGVES